MFQKLKRKYIDWSIRSFLKKKKSDRKKQFINLQDTETVVVLVSAEQLTEASLAKITKKIDTNKIVVWSYKSESSVSFRETLNVHFFDRKSVSLFQKPNKKEEANFLSDKCDVLIDLTTEESFPLKYLLGISNAACKCGMHKEGYDKLYDFEMNMPNKTNIEILLDQILYYLNTIQTKA